MPSAWPSLSVRSDSVWKSLVFKLCSLCGNPQVIFPWTVARFRALPSSTSKTCSALEGRPASRGAPSIPSRWFQTRMSPRWRRLVVFVRLLYIWCSTWKIPWPTRVWNKSPHPHASLLSQGSLSLFSAHLVHTCLSGGLSGHFWTFLTSGFSSCTSQSPQAIGKGTPMPQRYSERLVSRVGFETL